MKAFHQSGITLDQSQSKSLQGFSKKNAVTLNATLQALWALVLSKLLKSNNIVFGSTVNGRTGTGLRNAEEVIGMFMNVIPVSVSINENETFAQLVKNIQTFQNEVLKYEYLSLKDIMDFRNDSYKPVLLEGSFKLGDVVKVKINKTTKFDLRGEVVQ